MQLVLSTSSDPAFNLATEEFLFNSSDEEFAFFYRNNPCVVIGCNQVWHHEVDAVFCDENQIPVLRRLSGGGAVYHDPGNLNYSFISRKSPLNPGTTSDFLHPLVEALARLGVMSIIGHRKDLWLHGGYKISGTASHVTLNRVLQHGTLLYDTNLEMLQGALNPPRNLSPAKGIASVPSPVKNIIRYKIEKSASQYVGVESSSEFFRSLIRELVLIMKLDNERKLTADEHKKIVAIKQDRYDNESWNRKK
jgi:lipoate-protein ligase A